MSQSEAQLERQLLDELKAIGYSEIFINDEIKLFNNFRKQLYLHNQRVMQSKPFSDKEFEKVLLWLEGKSVFASAKLLRDKMPLERDDNKKIDIEFLDSKAWCKNIFQITSQTTIQGVYSNRYDVTILVNGLPLVQIELKKRGLGLDEAINQIERYRKHSYTRLYRYIQVFVVSNGVDTKYFANSDKQYNKNYAFFWTDKDNNRITNLSNFTSTFLDKCFVSKIIARYMVLNESDKTLMIMRPYQIYAVEALVDRAFNTANNGYVWHTTGSGKTLTSFKASQIIAQAGPHIKKVFFLVDRKDLDRQTIDEFNKFEKDSVDTTDKTNTLIQHIKDINKKLIVTTIQKMSNAIKSKKYDYILDQYKEQKVVFIIDECHRTQFGDMHKLINKHFVKAQYFGFTGTPRLPINKSIDDRTTADIFGNGNDDRACLHSYLIKNAIADGNVLGFNVEYIKTINGDIDDKGLDEDKVSGVDFDEIYNHKNRLEFVSNHILQHHTIKTQNNKYCAIFTVSSIPTLVEYYKILQDKNKNSPRPLKIAAIFSYGANEDYEGREEHSRDSLEKIMNDYNVLYNTNYNTDNFAGYFADICRKTKNAEIDILLVVNMLLTGFDSKLLNTLYVDKNLKYHDLIQAYSRTNRVYDASKPYGQIVCYRNLKDRTDEAIKIFSKTDNADTVLMQDIAYYKKRFVDFLTQLKTLAPTVESVDNLQSETDIKEFVVLFRELARTLIHLNSFLDFDFDKSSLGILYQEYLDYRSKYLDIKIKVEHSPKTSILAYIDFCAELVHTDKINFDYILGLIRDIELSNTKQQNKDINSILQLLENNSNEYLYSKLELIKKFLQTVVPTLPNYAVIDAELDKYITTERTKEIQEFATKIGFDYDILCSMITKYEFDGLIDNAKIADNLQLGLLQKASKTQKIEQFIKNNVQKFN